MQTLGLSDSTPRSEGRLKALLWPSIRNDVDLDFVTTQGFWICMLVASLGFAVSLFTGSGVIIGVTFFESLVYFLAGIGVRMRSRFAAIFVFVAYFLTTIVLQKETGQGFGLGRFLVLALLLSNVRGIWLSASWTAEQTDVVPVRLNETWCDKLSDQLPAELWPKVRVFFYVIAALELLLLAAALLLPQQPALPPGAPV